MFYQLLRPYLKPTSHMILKRGEVIYHEGEEPKVLYLIDSGVVGLFHISENGKETFLRVFNKDCIFGHRSFFAQTNYHATAIALTDTKVSLISKETCEQICQERPELLKEMTKLLARSLGEAELRLAGLMDKSVNRRVVESLVFFKLKYPEKVWTRREIAEFSGSTYETVARVMTILSNEGLITKKGRDFDIPSIENLLSYAEDNF